MKPPGNLISSMRPACPFCRLLLLSRRENDAVSGRLRMEFNAEDVGVSWGKEQAMACLNRLSSYH